jgi:hypothetical protein
LQRRGEVLSERRGCVVSERGLGTGDGQREGGLRAEPDRVGEPFSSKRRTAARRQAANGGGDDDEERTKNRRRIEEEMRCRQKTADAATERIGTGAREGVGRVPRHCVLADGYSSGHVPTRAKHLHWIAGLATAFAALARFCYVQEKMHRGI